MDEIFGYLEKITFQNSETGYTVAQLKEPKKSETTCIIGNMPTVQPGETLRCCGHWKRHLIHGMQFQVESYKSEAPADIMGIKKYLGSGLVPGIGPTYAKKIVDHFGLETLDIIEMHPERLLEIYGLGKKRLDRISASWNEQKMVRDVMIFLQSHNVTPAYAQKIFKVYGTDCIKKVTTNPYSLARDIRGIGFAIADKIAQTLGIAKESEFRIDAGIEFVLNELSEEGHVCYPLHEFLVLATERLEVSQEKVSARLAALQNDQRIELFDLVLENVATPFIWKKPLFVSELGVAKEIKRLQTGFCHLRRVDLEKAIEWVQEFLKITLAQNQKEAVKQALTEKFLVITGGPGTGKSTITNAILTITRKLTTRILLAAPTGRAAKRMTEITGYKAQTIHSLLEFSYQAAGFKKNRENPLDCDLLIVDEASMIDTYLMYQLLKAVPDYARLVLVGDVNQLPSVGPGNILKDIISSGCTPVTQLTEIFRQAAGSRIITNAHRINNGVFPDIRNLSDSDFFFIIQEKPEDILSQIINLVTVRLPKKYPFNIKEDIQVLSPMRKGVIGTENLNAVLQEAINPSSNPIFKSGRRFHVGDKVMQIKNDYKKEVFNGDIGIIRRIDATEQKLIVSFDEKEVIYEFSDMEDLVLAYAVSIHKYQGSESPCVIIPVHTTHFKMMHRNLLYTGVTRGKKLVILLGTTKALGIAVKNDEVKKRYTGLQQALIGILSAPLPNLSNLSS